MKKVIMFIVSIPAVVYIAILTLVAIRLTTATPEAIPFPHEAICSLTISILLIYVIAAYIRRSMRAVAILYVMLTAVIIYGVIIQATVLPGTLNDYLFIVALVSCVIHFGERAHEAFSEWNGTKPDHRIITLAYNPIEKSIIFSFISLATIEFFLAMAQIPPFPHIGGQWQYPTLAFYGTVSLCCYVCGINLLWTNHLKKQERGVMKDRW